ncbi:hypothetical protein CPJCM30710_10350 [Clostridium polyendosporum]|uniref:DUF1523 domain-containing protein n=1 Tax=Clostridium polyendosporum TaxID=69208 RepID=A0A919RZ01_9CLOT|nr:DUF1523 domain-containing protein [Clostridium polyendosporum]GIM28369.1 hypothetical protein CPJCM30710_10350 [Clostridium polyendosporum]
MIKNIFYQFRNNNFIKFRIGAVIISVIVTIGVIMFFPHFFRNTYIVTITNKRIIKHDNVDTYLIYSQMEDGNIKIFENVNSLPELKFNSEALYWSLTINRKYEVKAYGLSIPSLSYYQNIVKVKGVEK